MVTADIGCTRRRRRITLATRVRTDCTRSAPAACHTHQMKALHACVMCDCERGLHNVHTHRHGKHTRARMDLVRNILKPPEAVGEHMLVDEGRIRR